MLIDGIRGPALDGIASAGGSFGSFLVLSPDQTHYAYCGGEGTKYVYVIDGVKDPPVKKIQLTLVFSPKSTHYAYVIEDKGKSAIVINGFKGEPFDTPIGSLSVSDDGEASLWVFNDNGTITRRIEKRDAGIDGPQKRRGGKK